MDRLRIGIGGDRAIAELAGPGDEIVVGNDVYGGTFRYLERVRRGAGVDSIYVDLEAGPDVLWRRRLTERTWPPSSRRPRTRCSRSSTSTRSRRPSAPCGGGRPPATHRGRQHVRVACPAAAAPARRGHRLPLGDEVPGRPFGHGRRRGGRRPGGGAAASLPAERDGRRAQAARLLPRPARSADRPSPDGAARRQRRRGRCVADRTDLADVRYPGFGGMVSFIPAAGGVAGRTAAERATAIAEGTCLFTLAESLGGVESLIEVPAASDLHVGRRLATRGDPALVRLSVGIEGIDDLIADPARALDESPGQGVSRRALVGTRVSMNLSVVGVEFVQSGRFLGRPRWAAMVRLPGATLRPTTVRPSPGSSDSVSRPSRPCPSHRDAGCPCH